MRHSESGNKKMFEPEELGRLLRVFWLSTEDGPMSPVIDSTVKAYTYRRPLAVVHEVGPAAPVSETLSVLGVKHTVHVRVPDPEPPFLKVDFFPGPEYSPPLPDESKGIRRVYVPSMSERFSDFELLVPCILNRVLVELNACRPTKVPGVEGLLLLLLWYLLKSHRVTMTNVIRDAVIDAEGGTVSVPRDFPSSEDGGAFFGWLQELTPGPPRYIGIGKDSDKSGEDFPEIVHWLNREAACVYFHQETVNSIVNQGDFVPRPAKRAHRYMQRPVAFELKDIGLAARNLAKLVSKPTLTFGKAHTVLKLRLSGKAEESIRRTMNFTDDDTYRRFLDDKFMSITCDNPRDILGEWEEARDRLFGDRKNLAPEPEELISGGFLSRDAEVRHRVETVRKDDMETAADAGNSCGHRMSFFESDYAVVYRDDKFRFRDSRRFEALQYIVKEMKAGNRYPNKVSIFAECKIDVQSARSMSVHKWFLSAGGDPRRFAEKFLKSDGRGGCTIDIDPDLIEIIPYEQFDEDDSEDEGE